MKSYAKEADRLRCRHTREPHWYLQLLGVDPQQQGTGQGGLLLRTMLARLDREGVPCSLDTENSEVVPLYEHFGFRVREESVIPGTGCACWFMVREVGGAPAA